MLTERISVIAWHFTKIDRKIILPLEWSTQNRQLILHEEHGTRRENCHSTRFVVLGTMKQLQ